MLRLKEPQQDLILLSGHDLFEKPVSASLASCTSDPVPAFASCLTGIFAHAGIEGH